MTLRPLPIFVYGTLKRGDVRHGCWPRPAVHIEPASTLGQLIDLGPYPGMIEGNDKVLGELWHMDPRDLPITLNVLDQVEGYVAAAGDVYQRVEIDCLTLEGKACQAYAYRYVVPIDMASAVMIEPDQNGYASWTPAARARRLHQVPDQQG